MRFRRPLTRCAIYHFWAAIGVMVLTVAACTQGRIASPPPQPAHIPRIAYLSPGAVSTEPIKDVFLQQLGGLGYRNGETIEIDFRFLLDTDRSLEDIASELAGEDLDAIVAIGTPRVLAMKRATRTTPIVMASAVDPVGAGLITSLARPGGNVTGVATVTADLAEKRLEMLKQAVPSLSRVAVLTTPRWRDPESPVGLQWQGVQEASVQLGITAQLVEVSAERRNADTIAELERAIDSAADDGADGLFPLSDAFFDATSREIAATALQDKLPSIYRRADYVNYSGLLAYGPSVADEYGRVASYVDRIIRGAKPSDLPVSLPTRFDLAVSLRTADALGICLPEEFVAQAEQPTR